MPDVHAIDCWVNASVGASRERAPEYALRTAEEYCKRSKDFFKKFFAEELIEIMDRVGVEKAILTLPAENPSEKILPRSLTVQFPVSSLDDPCLPKPGDLTHTVAQAG